MLYSLSISQEAWTADSHEHVVLRSESERTCVEGERSRCGHGGAKNCACVRLRTMNGEAAGGLSSKRHP